MAASRAPVAGAKSGSLTARADTGTFSFGMICETPVSVHDLPGQVKPAAVPGGSVG